jgi:hypothetical protein
MPDFERILPKDRLGAGGMFSPLEKAKNDHLQAGVDRRAAENAGKTATFDDHLKYWQDRLLPKPNDTEE